MNPIEKLQAERQRIVARLTEIDNILVKYDELQRAAENFFSTDAQHTLKSDSDNNSDIAHDSHRAEPSSIAPHVPVTQRSKTPMADFERAVMEILSETETPLNRSALYKALIDRDVVIGSPDESADLNTLSARMSRMNEKVVNINSYGYWLKHRSFVAGGYEPEEERVTTSSTDLNAFDIL